MKLLTFFFACLYQLGGTKIKREKRDRRSKGRCRDARTQCCKKVDQWLLFNVANVLKNNSAVEYEGINIESTFVLVT